MLEPLTLPWPTGATIHLVGVGGAGMSSLALILRDAGYRVTGSDLVASSTIDGLRKQGIVIQVGHHSQNVGEASILVRSSAVPLDNPEIVSATQRGTPVLKHSEALGALSRVRRTLAVAGTHGKTTTTAMLATILLQAGMDPTVLVGGVVPTLGSGAHWGTSDLLVAEADEFDRRFLDLQPEIAIVNNLEADHLDYFGSIEAIVEAFEQFIQAVPDEGWRLLCADSPLAMELADLSPDRSVTYGLTESAEWQAIGISSNSLGGNDFYVMANGTLVGHFRLAIPGRHNVSNALAAAVAAGRIGVDFTTAAAALEEFHGVERRLQRKGEQAGVVVYDDYGHHPTEIRVTLSAAREGQSGRLLCLFQPHTYHRLNALFEDFAEAFADADVVVVSDVYSPAGRGPSSGDRGAADLASAIVDAEAHFGGSLDESIALLVTLAAPGDMIVTMGAGDVTEAGTCLLALLTERNARPSGGNRDC
ncbi:MAG TPA: UDP-N-acetylmuramate--L-alanine ligase [Chloroflexota bacterium]|nr:UDP-N-acetylmuramate--L-alanine ligase [Chloroflexota bacterium]